LKLKIKPWEQNDYKSLFCLLFMTQKVIVKVKVGTDNPRIESFGGNRYLAYITENDDNELKELLSRQLGTPVNRINIVGKQGPSVVVEVG